MATDFGLPPSLQDRKPIIWIFLALAVFFAVWLDIRRGHTDQVSRVVPRQLPPNIRLVGRRREIKLLYRSYQKYKLLRSKSSHGSLFVISGPPGIGKSALVIHFSHRLEAQHGDGSLYVNLQAADRNPALALNALSAMLSGLGVESEKIVGDEDQLGALFRSRTRELRLLIVLDNAKNASQVVPLIPSGSHCTTIVTSRMAIPLSSDATAELHLEPLSRKDSISFLQSISRRGRAVDERLENEAAERISEYCGGLPLALRIATARLRGQRNLTPTDLALRLSNEQQRLGELSVGDLEVRSSFAAALSGLEPSAIRAFTLLGISQTPMISMAAAAAILGADGEKARRLLDRLVEENLLESRPNDSFVVHDLLRLFARDMLRNDKYREETSAAVRRLYCWYCRKAHDWGQIQKSSNGFNAESAAWLRQEWVGVVHSLNEAYRDGKWHLIWETTESLARIFYYCSLWQPLEQLSELAIIAAREAHDQRQVGLGLRNLGIAKRHGGDRPGAISAFESAATILTATGNVIEGANCYKDIGEINRLNHDHSRAFKNYQLALELLPPNLREIDFQVSRAHVLGQLGAAYMEIGDFEQSLRMYVTAEQDFRESGTEGGIAWIQYYLAGMYALKGDLATAEERLRRGLNIYVAQENIGGQAWLLHFLGRVLASRGRWKEAEKAFQDVIELQKSMHEDTSRAELEMHATRKRRVMSHEGTAGWF